MTASDRETMQRLADLLADDDVQAITLWNEFSTRLESLFGRQLDALRAALAAYDFAAARALLEPFLEDSEFQVATNASTSLPLPR